MKINSQAYVFFDYLTIFVNILFTIRLYIKSPSLREFNPSQEFREAGNPPCDRRLFVIFNIKIIQECFIGILTVKAGFDKKALLVIPFL